MPENAGNGGKRPNMPKNGPKRPYTAENARLPPTTPGIGIEGLWEADSDGMVHEVQLFAVSLVREPTNPHCRVISVDGRPV